MTDAPIAGWYPDPQDAAAWRWWDGADWTSDVVTRPGAAKTPVDEAPRRPADWGWDNTPVLASAGAAVVAPERTAPKVTPAKAAKAEKPAKPAKAEKPQRAAKPATAGPAAGADPTASTSTAWIWILVFSPIIYGVLAGALLQYVLPLFTDEAADTLLLVAIALLVVPVVPLWIFADLDGRALRTRGFDAPSVLWMLLLPPLAYFVGRAVLLRRAGASSLAPLIALIVVLALVAAAVVLLLSAILAILTSLGVTIPGLPLG